MRIRLAAPMAALALSSVTVQADPSATINKFMDTPASLFSIGMMRLNEEVGRSLRDTPASTGEKYIGSASFDWDKNQINLEVKRYAIKPSQPDFEQECKEVVDNVRMGGMVVDGKPLLGEVSYYSKLFFPQGYSLKAFGAEDARNLDQLTTIRFSTISTTTPMMKCSAPLIGTGYSIEKE